MRTATPAVRSMRPAMRNVVPVSPVAPRATAPAASGTARWNVIRVSIPAAAVTIAAATATATKVRAHRAALLERRVRQLAVHDARTRPGTSPARAAAANFLRTRVASSAASSSCVMPRTPMVGKRVRSSRADNPPASAPSARVGPRRRGPGRLRFPFRFRFPLATRPASCFQQVRELARPLQGGPLVVGRAAHRAVGRNLADGDLLANDGGVGGADDAAVGKADEPGGRRLHSWVGPAASREGRSAGIRLPLQITPDAAAAPRSKRATRRGFDASSAA